jgi:hypothetical protein
MPSIDIYPDPDPESTSIDGSLLRTSSTKADCRNNTNATQVVSNGLTGFIGSYGPGTSWLCYRLFHLFDTSPIGTGQQVTSATIYVYVSIRYGYIIHVVSSSPASNTDLVAADYGTKGDTSFGSWDESSFTNGSYCSAALNASGLTAINMTGVSKFALRTAQDLDDSTWPTATARATYHFAEQTGTTTDPYLRVVYSAATVPSVLDRYVSTTSTDVKYTSGALLENMSKVAGITL